MKKLLTILCVVIMFIPVIYIPVSDYISKKEDSEKFVIVDITMENYMDYIDFVATDTAIDIDGNPINHTCVVVTSKLYDKGLYYISSEDSKWDIQLPDNSGLGIIGSSPLGAVLENVSSPDHVKVTNIQGKYKFVKSEYVDEYIFENGVRKLTLKDGRYQEIVFEGFYAVDFSHPY